MNIRKHWWCDFISCDDFKPCANLANANITAIFSGAIYSILMLIFIFSPAMPIGEKIGTALVTTWVFGCMWICFVIPYWLEWSCYSDKEKKYLEKMEL